MATAAAASTKGKNEIMESSSDDSIGFLKNHQNIVFVYQKVNKNTQ